MESLEEQPVFSGDGQKKMSKPQVLRGFIDPLNEWIFNGELLQ